MTGLSRATSRLPCGLFTYLQHAMGSTSRGVAPGPHRTTITTRIGAGISTSTRPKASPTTTTETVPVAATLKSKYSLLSGVLSRPIDGDHAMFPPRLLTSTRLFSSMPSNIHGHLPTLEEEPKYIDRATRLIHEHTSFPVVRLGDCGPEGEGAEGEGAEQYDGDEEEPLPDLHLSPLLFSQPLRLDILTLHTTYSRSKHRGYRNPAARTKTVSEVSGSGKKMRAQKGSGMARIGHKRAAHHRGGAKAHGPKGSIQNYRKKLDKRVRRLGARVVLSQKLREGNLVIVDDFRASSIQTKSAKNKLVEKLSPYGYDDYTSALFVTGDTDVDRFFRLSVRNLPNVTVIPAGSFGALEALKSRFLVLSVSAVLNLEKKLSE